MYESLSVRGGGGAGDQEQVLCHLGLEVELVRPAAAVEVEVLALESREPASLARRQFACPQTIFDIPFSVGEMNHFTTHDRHSTHRESRMPHPVHLNAPHPHPESDMRVTCCQKWRWTHPSLPSLPDASVTPFL